MAHHIWRPLIRLARWAYAFTRLGNTRFTKILSKNSVRIKDGEARVGPTPHNTYITKKSVFFLKLI